MAILFFTMVYTDDIDVRPKNLDYYIYAIGIIELYPILISFLQCWFDEGFSVSPHLNFRYTDHR